MSRSRLTSLLKRIPGLYPAWRALRRVRPVRALLEPGATPAALRRHARAARNAEPDFAGEAAHLRRLLERTGLRSGTVVDLGAGDGVFQSCTLFLMRDPAWQGLAVEMDAMRFRRLEAALGEFPNVRLANEKVTPINVVALLEQHGVPARFDVLNLDLDSYDLWVAQALLRCYRPAIITMEINEKIPPPVYFTVCYDGDHVWNEDHFYGCSLTAAAARVRPHGYILEALEYNNAFFLRTDLAGPDTPDLPVERAYAEGYRDRPDRRDLFPWNRDVEHLLTLPADRVLAELDERFREYQGRYHLRLEDAD